MKFKTGALVLLIGLTVIVGNGGNLKDDVNKSPWQQGDCCNYKEELKGRKGDIPGIPFESNTKNVVAIRTSTTIEKKLALPQTNPYSFDKEKKIVAPSAKEALINKKNFLPKEYKPKDLIIPKIPFGFKEKLEKKYLRKEAARALEKLVAASQKEGLKLYGASGYRSYRRQETLYNAYVRNYGQKKADTFSAKPGFSEHQSGLAMDMTTPSIGYGIDDGFATTKEGKWLAKNAYQFGFVIRYPKGKEKVTSYKYEPWHIRYVGVDSAKKLHENQWTLEEFYQNLG